MLARSGLIGCPCPVPVSLMSSLPSSMTPTCIHFRISRSTLLSLTRFSIISMSCSLTIVSKYEVISNSRIHPVSADDPSHFVQCLVCPSSGSEPVGAVEKILLVDGMQYFDHHLLHDLVLEGGNRDRPLFPVFLGDIDSAQRLGSILAIFEPLMHLADVSRSV